MFSSQYISKSVLHSLSLFETVIHFVKYFTPTALPLRLFGFLERLGRFLASETLPCMFDESSR
ncbi:hypothetical protein IC582_001817 [Cucumis melo]